MRKPPVTEIKFEEYFEDYEQEFYANFKEIKKSISEVNEALSNLLITTRVQIELYEGKIIIRYGNKSLTLDDNLCFEDTKENVEYELTTNYGVSIVAHINMFIYSSAHQTHFKNQKKAKLNIKNELMIENKKEA